MYTPHGGGSERSRREEPVSAAEHYSCGLVGLLATAVLALFFYSYLVALTRPLHLFASTALVFGLVLVWLVVWMTLELAWEWRTGRFATEE